MDVSGLVIQNYHYQIAILRAWKMRKHLFSKGMPLLYRNSYSTNLPFQWLFLRSFVDFCTYSYLKTDRVKESRSLWDVMWSKVIFNSLLVCSAAEWQRIAADILRFCFHWNREWQTAEITKGIFFLNTAATEQLLRYSPLTFSVCKCPDSQLILEEHKECGLYFMTCNQWTCSISFINEFCFYIFHLSSEIAKW